MTVDEKYNRRVNLCRTLRVLEDELEKIINTRSKYSQSEGNKKVTISIYCEGENVQSELDEKTANRCMEAIENSYYIQRNDIVQTLKQELR